MDRAGLTKGVAVWMATTAAVARYNRGRLHLPYWWDAIGYVVRYESLGKHADIRESTMFGA